MSLLWNAEHILLQEEADRKARAEAFGHADDHVTANTMPTELIDDPQNTKEVESSPTEGPPTTGHIENKPRLLLMGQKRYA